MHPRTRYSHVNIHFLYMYFIFDITPLWLNYKILSQSWMFVKLTPNINVSSQEKITLQYYILHSIYKSFKILSFLDLAQLMWMTSYHIMLLDIVIEIKEVSAINESDVTIECVHEELISGKVPLQRCWPYLFIHCVRRHVSQMASISEFY